MKLLEEVRMCAIWLGRGVEACTLCFVLRGAALLLLAC